jgi:Domain of unknown function (DUF4091)
MLAVVAMMIISTTPRAMTMALSSSFAVWVAPSLERIGQNDNAGRQKNIQLFAARGEYESFQIGIKAPENDLKITDVVLSDLSGPNNQIIQKNNFTLYREHYVAVNNSSPKEEGSSNQPLGKGLYPDGLIPFVNPQTQAALTGNELDAIPFELGAKKNQPIWVDLFVPRNAQPGNYEGTYTVTSDQGEFTGEISLKVWNFELPVKPSLLSSFVIWDDANKNKNVFVELLKHKIMPGTEINPAIQRELIDEWGLNALKLPFFSGANQSNGTMSPPPSVSEIKAKKAKNVPGLFQFIFSVDEIDKWPNLREPLKQWAKNIKEAGVKHLVVMKPEPEFYKNTFFNGEPAIDTWVIEARTYNEFSDRVSDVLKNEGEVWFYTALVPDDYSPKWLIDYAPINFRIPHGFINQSLGFSGVLYWALDDWQGNPWKQEQTIFQGGNYHPGEGTLVYPGQQLGINGIVPSMRLKWIRDGVDDYEYVQILKRLGGKDRALQISRSIAPDWKNWEKNPAKLEQAKQILGNEIEKKVD